MKNPIKNIRNFVGSLKGYGGCLRCGDSWSWKKEHNIPCSDRGGIFPLCEECWSKIDKDEKIFWVKELYNKWQRFGPVDKAHRAKIISAIGAIERGN